MAERVCVKARVLKIEVTSGRVLLELDPIQYMVVVLDRLARLDLGDVLSGDYMVGKFLKNETTIFPHKLVDILEIADAREPLKSFFVEE